MTILWCIVPEISGTTDRNFCHFGLFFVLLLPNNPGNQNFERMKKTPGDIIISQICTKNHDHMLCCSWDMAYDTCNFDFSFWAIFALLPPSSPIPPPNSPKNQNFKKWKKDLEVSSFYTSVPNIMIRWCMVPEIWCTTGGWTDGRMEKVTYRSGYST